MTVPVLARLKELAADARREGRVVKALLTGAEGAGRSHALAALVTALRADGFTCHTAALRDGPAAASLVHALAPGLPDAPGALLDALAAAPRLAGLEPTERRTAAELLASLLGVVDPGFGTASLDPESRREGAFAELGRWLAHAAAGAPLLLGVDDVHAADGDSAALVDFLGNLGDALPLLLVVTVDADRQRTASAAVDRVEAWHAEPTWAHLALATEPTDVVLALIADEGVRGDAAAAIAARAAGNPGLALTLARFARHAPGTPLPETAAVLRVETVRALGDDAFALARRLAALGPDTPVEALAAAKVDLAALPALEAGGVARRVGPEGGRRVRFADGRTRAALAADLPAGEAEALRRSVASWARATLERAAPDALSAVAALVPLAVPALDEAEASLWNEARASVLADRGRILDALVSAANGAHGVRRVVLLRRIAELHVLAGQPERALETLKTVSRGVPPVSSLPGTPAGRAVNALVRAPLDRWHALVPDAALAAVELTRAEALSHLVRKEETQAAFTELERRLARLTGLPAAQLWVRWAKSWAWFLCEILRRPLDAQKACQAVRRAVPPDLLKDGELALGLVRAEEVAASSAGDFSGALARVEEHLRLTQAQHNLRDGCLAWNARAILHFGQGELAPARKAFAKAIEQARGTGWLRRDAISTHNLALVLTELGAYDEAHAAETRYAKLSVTIGNHAATAEAPAVLAGVALGRRDARAAEAYIAQAQKAAETNGWAMLLAWARVLSARLRVLRYLERKDTLDLARSKNDFLAALDALEEHSTAWSEELDPGEVYALYAAVQKVSGQASAGRATLERAARLLPKENVVSHRALTVGQAFVDGRGLEDALAWFDARGYARLVGWWRSLA